MEKNDFKAKEKCGSQQKESRLSGKKSSTQKRHELDQATVSASIPPIDKHSTFFTKTKKIDRKAIRYIAVIYTSETDSETSHDPIFKSKK